MSKSLSDSTRSEIGKYELVLSAVLTIVFVVLLGFMRSPIEAEDLSWIKKIDIKGVYSVNEKLTRGKNLSLPGPECVVEDEDKNIYTGLRDGRLLKISPDLNGKIGEGLIETFFLSYFPHLPSSYPNASHGRPLGLRIRGKKLFVMDSIYGLYTIHLETKEVDFLVSLTDVYPPMKLPDDLDITSDDKFIYFTDACQLFPIHLSIYSFFEGKCTGRLFRYEISTKKIETLVEGLCFANGVQLSRDEKMLVLAESLPRRINYFNVNDFSLKSRVLLPTLPDNVRINKRGNYWVGSNTPYDDILLFLFSKPLLRNIMSGLIPISTIMKHIPKQHSVLLELNDEGKVLQSLHDPYASLVEGISHGSDLSDGRIALGSYMGDKLAFADIND